MTETSTKETANVLLILVGYLMLFIVAFLDTIRGPLLPILTTQLNLDYEQSSWIFISGNISAILMTLLMIPVLRKFGEIKISLFVSYLILLIFVLAFFVKNIFTLIIFSFCIGTAVSIVGALCNVFTLQGANGKYSLQIISGLHTMYGLGSLMSPLIAKWCLESNQDWPLVFATTLPLTLTLIFLLKNKINLPHHFDEKKMRLPINKNVLLLLSGFSFYVVAEVMTSMWMTTFFVKTKFLNVQDASFFVAKFFIIFTLMRFLTTYFVQEKWISIFIFLSLFISLVSFTLALCFQQMDFLPYTAFMSPIFPLFLSKIKIEMPPYFKELMFWIVISVQVMMAFFHHFMGWMIESGSIRLAFYIPFFSLIICGLSIFIFLKQNPKLAN